MAARESLVVTVGSCVLLTASMVAAAPATETRPAKERRLHLAAAEASSFLVNDWNKFQENYLPLYVGDDDPRTAWNLKNEGIGEWLRMRVTPMEGATRVRLKIRNGYQKTSRLYQANSRARAVTVVLLPENKTFDVELADKDGWQELTVEQPPAKLDAIELRVKSVYPGKKYDDLCISDVQVHVTAASSDNPAFEKQRFDKILEWKQERVAAAKLFETELGRRLPIAAQYAMHVVEEDRNGRDDAEPAGSRDFCPKGAPCYMQIALKRAADAGAKGTHAASLRAAFELARSGFAGMTPVRITARDPRPIPRVDGTCTPPLDACQDDPCYEALPLPMTKQIGYFDAEALALTEQTGLPSFADAMTYKVRQCHSKEQALFAWALRDASPAPGGTGRLRALLLVSCGLVRGREGYYPAAVPQLLVYGGDGKLEIVAGTYSASALDWRIESDGPKLAHAALSGQNKYEDMTFDAVVAVAKQ